MIFAFEYNLIRVTIYGTSVYLVIALTFNPYRLSLTWEKGIEGVTLYDTGSRPRYGYKMLKELTLEISWMLPALDIYCGRIINYPCPCGYR